ncbi:hypothetical protein [Microbulbifer sp. HZ11]|uniref:hypothetical protein n=1 Tax=Microbulbifer sp. HZ11 TaxID=1453501 RepID=UPI0005BE1AED|nr:hypothetical protein [Microbulbifer sp. HZ11]
MKRPLSREAELHLAHQLHQLNQNLTIRADGTVQEFSALRACYTDHSLADLEYGVEGAMALQRAAGAELAAFAQSLLDLLTENCRKGFAPDDVRNLKVPRTISGCLYRGKIRSLSELSKATDQRILDCPGIGPHRLSIIKAAIHARGYCHAN